MYDTCAQNTAGLPRAQPAASPAGRKAHRERRITLPASATVSPGVRDRCARHVRRSASPPSDGVSTGWRRAPATKRERCLLDIVRNAGDVCTASTPTMASTTEQRRESSCCAMFRGEHARRIAKGHALGQNVDAQRAHRCNDARISDITNRHTQTQHRHYRHYTHMPTHIPTRIPTHKDTPISTTSDTGKIHEQT